MNIRRRAGGQLGCDALVCRQSAKRRGSDRAQVGPCQERNVGGIVPSKGNLTLPLSYLEFNQLI